MILVACEHSQRVCTEFRTRGYEAYSCDMIPCSGGHPEWHIIGDARNIMNGDCDFTTSDGTKHHIEGEWDALIAHPPCTYLTNGGAVRVFRKEIKEFPPYGTFQMVNVERVREGIKARDFFMACLNAKCKRIAVENPVPMSIFALPECSQIIEPHMFGDPYSKKTCLWLRGLPGLIPTEIGEGFHPFINGGGGRLERENYKGQKFAEGSLRSITFPGIAKAMAEQWGSYMEEKKYV